MSITEKPLLVIIGGGATGTGIAREAVRRGWQFVLIERGSLGSGTSGRFHGVLHSGARYAVADLTVADECYQENQRLRQLMPTAISDTGGLFVALTEAEAEHGAKLQQACKTAGIPCKEITPSTALRREPQLTSDIHRAFIVPDGFIDGGELLRLNQAAAPGRYVTNTNVIGFERTADHLQAVVVQHQSGERETITGDYFINAAGVWAATVADLAGLSLDMLFDKGTMITFKGELTRHVINRCRPEADGDLLVPHAGTSIMGTTARVVATPEDNLPTQEEADVLVREGAMLVPALAHTEALRIYAGIRPLARPDGRQANGPSRSVSRSFSVIDHTEQGISNMYSVVGGKVTLHRLMAEAMLDTLEQGR